MGERSLRRARRTPSSNAAVPALETAAHVQHDVAAVFALHFNGQALRAHRITLPGYVKVTTGPRTGFSGLVTLPRHNCNTCA